MRITSFRCAMALTLLFAIPAPAMAQNLVRGTVKDSKDKPVEGALVYFEAIDFVAKRDTKTNKNGEYLFQGLGSGDYNVTASKAGVGVHTRKYTISSMSAKERLDFFLMPDKAMLEAAAAKAAAAAAAKPAARPAGPPPPEGLESLAVDAAAVARGKELAALQAVAAAAVDAQKAGRHDEAVTKFNEVLAQVPECGDCYVRLGASYSELKRHDEAIASFKKSLAVRPSVEAYTALARIYNSQKKFDLASEATKDAAELAEKLSSPPAGSAPGTPGAAAGPATGAAASETLYNRGVVLWNSGKYAEAKAQFEAAVKAKPDNADAQYQLGMANLNLGQIPAARAAFEAYLKAAPGGPKAAEVKTFLTQLPK